MAAATHGPFYIRLSRPKLPLVYDEDYRFKLGKAVTMRQGSGATIIAIGTMVALALKCAENLKQAGIDCQVLNMPTVKPVDEAAIIQAAAETGAIVAAEEHLEHRGQGSIVAHVLAEHQPGPVGFVAS